MSKAKKQIPHPITLKIQGTGVYPSEKELQDESIYPLQLGTRERMYYSEKMIQIVLDEAFVYLEENPRCISLLRYIFHKKLTRRAWDLWRKKYPWFETGHSDLKQILALRREDGMVLKEMGMDKEALRWTMHLHDPGWLDVNKYWSDLKSDEKLQEAIKYITWKATEPTGHVKPNPRNIEAVDDKKE